MVFVSLGGRRVRIAWLFVIVVVVGLMLVPYAAYGRGGPPDHARGRPPLSPPVGPPLSPPVGPPLSPPVGPPLSPPVGPPLSPPVGPPTHARAAAEHARGQRFVTVEVADPIDASVHRDTSRGAPKATGRR
jgi:hypothetical protein